MPRVSPAQLDGGDPAFDVFRDRKQPFILVVRNTSTFTAMALSWHSVSRSSLHVIIADISSFQSLNRPSCLCF
jgi:hypothetical protein